MTQACECKMIFLKLTWSAVTPSNLYPSKKFTCSISHHIEGAPVGGPPLEMSDSEAMKYT